RVAEEVARVDQLGGVIEGVVVDQDRAEDGFLGFEIVRQGAFGSGGSDGVSHRGMEGILRHGIREAHGIKRGRGMRSSSAPRIPRPRSVDRPSRVYAVCATTLTRSCAVTSRWILIGTVVSPSALSGSASAILRLSTS